MEIKFSIITKCKTPKIVYFDLWYSKILKLVLNHLSTLKVWSEVGALMHLERCVMRLLEEFPQKTGFIASIAQISPRLMFQWFSSAFDVNKLSHVSS